MMIIIYNNRQKCIMILHNDIILFLTQEIASPITQKVLRPPKRYDSDENDMYLFS